MHCKIWHVSEAIHLTKLFAYFQKKQLNPRLYKNVVYVPTEKCETFYFQYGVIVAWGEKKDLKENLTTVIEPFLENASLRGLEDTHEVSNGTKTYISDDHIYLGENSLMTKLAVSYGIAQSMKLTFFENMIEETIKKTESIPKLLAQKGRIGLSQKQISQIRGSIFLERSYINLHFEFVDSPEYFWENPEYERIFHTTSEYFEIANRVEIMNKKLEVIDDLFTVLADELNYRHSAFLEWIIIILIGIEIILSISGFFGYLHS